MKGLKKILIVLSLFFLTVNVYAKEFVIDSKYAVLYNLNDDNIIYELEKDKQISIASLTKIMTTLVAIENIDDLNKKVVITSNVFDGTEELSKAGFRIGETVTYLDLLYGAILPSGADATNALAINIAGSIDKYVAMMNDKAKELGLKQTHYINTTGLDAKGHYSSVDDVAKLLKYALKNEKFKKIFTTMTYKTSDGLLNFKSTILKNGTRYGISTKMIKGGKTGFTDEAGLCMASIATLSKVDYLLVTCGANTKDNTPHQILDAITIYNYYNSNYGYQTILSKNQELITLKVKNSYTESITFKSDKNIDKYIAKKFDPSLLKYKYDGIDILSPKNKVGDKIGTINIVYDDEILDKYDLYLDEEIKSNVLDKIIMAIGYLLAVTLLLLIIIDGFKKIIKKRHR